MNAQKLVIQIVTALGLLTLCNANIFAAGDPGPFFTGPKPLNSYATLDGGEDNQINPKIASDGDQTLMVAWNTGISDSPNTWMFNNVLVATSEDNGAAWSTPKQIFSGEANLASLTYNHNAWVAIWYNVTPSSRTTSRSLNLFCARSTDGQNWTDAEEIYSGPGIYNDVDTDGDQTIIVSTGAALLRSTDGGQSWSVVTLGIPESLSYRMEVQIASAGDDKWYLIAARPPGSSSLYTSQDDGATWSGPVDAQVSVTVQGYPPVDVFVQAQELAARGNTIVAAKYPTIVTSIDGGATWTTDVHPEGLPLWYDFPVPLDMEVDGDGNWIIATQEFDPPPHLEPPDPSEYHVTVSTSSDPAAGWTSAINVDTSGIRTQRPDVQSLGNGGFAVVYDRFVKDNGAVAVDSDIAITIKADAGSTWSQPSMVIAPGVIEVPFINDQEVLLKMGENGIVLAAWRASLGSRNDSDQVMVARSTNYGRSWTDPVVLRASSGTDSYIPEHNIVYAGHGRWLVSWTDTNGMKYCLSDDNGLSWSLPQPLDAHWVAANGKGTIIKSTLSNMTSRLPAGATSWEAPVPVPGLNSPINLVLMANTSGKNWCLITRGDPDQVYTSNDDGQTWVLQAGTNLPRNAHFDIDDSGNIVVMDAHSVSAFATEIFMSRSTNNGVDWSSPFLLTTVPTGTFSVPIDFIYGDIVHFGSSIWIVGLNNSKYALSGDGGATWTGLSPFPFGEVGISSRPSIAAKDGRIVFAWQQLQDPFDNHSDRDIYYSFGTYGVETAAQDWQLYE